MKKKSRAKANKKAVKKSSGKTRSGAKKAKKAVSTSPLNPHDRRIVHLALKKEDGVDTKSRGEGLLKKVIIIPKK